MTEIPTNSILRRHEVRDVSARWVVAVAGAIALGVGLLMPFTAAYMARLEERRPAASGATRLAHPGAAPPEPRLQANEAAEYGRYRFEQNQLLSTYGWRDRQAGVVRVPIERAMELLLERGLPATEGPPRTPVEMRQDRAKGGPP